MVVLTPPRRGRLESVKWREVPHRAWDRLWQLSGGDELVLWGPEGTVVREADGRLWSGPREVLMHFWPDRDFNVVTLLDPAGPPRFYCNVCLPPVAARHPAPYGWRYVDLDLDVVVTPEGAVEVRDEKEFRVNAERYGYPSGIRARARAGLEQLRALAQARGGPFAAGAAVPWLRLARRDRSPDRGAYSP